MLQTLDLSNCSIRGLLSHSASSLAAGAAVRNPAAGSSPRLVSLSLAGQRAQGCVTDGAPLTRSLHERAPTSVEEADAGQRRAARCAARAGALTAPRSLRWLLALQNKDLTGSLADFSSFSRVTVRLCPLLRRRAHGD